MPVDILENRALSKTARLTLAYLIVLASRPGWTIYVGQVCAALGLGEYAWTEARKQLEAAGYYWSERNKNPDGTWMWVHVVADVPHLPEVAGSEQRSGPNPSIPGKPGDGSPGHGSPGDIRSKKEHTNKKRTTTTTPDTRTVSLSYPERLKAQEVVVVDELTAEIPPIAQQELLDELAGAMAKPGMIRSSPVSYLCGLIKRFMADEFHPSLGIEVAAARQRRDAQAQKAADRHAEHQRRKQNAQADSTRKTAAANLAEIRASLGMTLKTSAVPPTVGGECSETETSAPKPIRTLRQTPVETKA